MTHTDGERSQKARVNQRRCMACILRMLTKLLCSWSKNKDKPASVCARSSAIAYVSLIPTLSCSVKGFWWCGFSIRESQVCKNFTALAINQHLPCTLNISADCKSVLFLGIVVIWEDWPKHAKVLNLVSLTDWSNSESRRRFYLEVVTKAAYSRLLIQGWKRTQRGTLSYM